MAPSARISLKEMACQTQAEGLVDGTLDLGLVHSIPDDADLDSVLIWHEPIVVALAEAHVLASYEEIPLALLREEAFVSLAPDASAITDEIAVDVCLASGYTPQIAHRGSSVPSVTSMVAAELGVALVPASVAHQSGSAGVAFRPLSEPAVTIPLTLVWARACVNAHVERFREMMVIGMPGLCPLWSPDVREPSLEHSPRD